MCCLRVDLDVSAHCKLSLVSAWDLRPVSTRSDLFKLNSGFHMQKKEELHNNPDIQRTPSNLAKVNSGT